jgi:hypothetical protein
MSGTIRSLAVLELDEQGNKKYGTPVPLSVHIDKVEIETDLKKVLSDAGITLSKDNLDILLRILATDAKEHKDSLVDSDSGVHGIRYDTDASILEVYDGTNWVRATRNIFTGTMAEYKTAYANGEIKVDEVVNILGDYDVSDEKVDADTLAGHTANAFALKSHRHTYSDLLYKPIVDGVLLDYPISGKSLRNIFVSTEPPTDEDGDNGDLWIVYAETTQEETQEEEE